jgi:caffeoyl-CoA O-methyltransferase
MEIVDPGMNAYSETHSSPESALLKKVNRETHVGVFRPRMLSGQLQGRFLSMVSHMIRPKAILEVGTYTGYSALCLAEGLAPGGKLYTIDINEELEERARKYFSESEWNACIEFRIGDALEIIPQCPGPFDLVWIDADKENYSRYFDLLIDQVRPGGFILADNVLWSGKVLDTKLDKDTRAIVDFNEKIRKDSRVEKVLLPIRDGIFLMRKI